MVTAPVSETFRLSPLIQITLINLYLALTVPLWVLAGLTQSWGFVGLGGLAVALGIGLLALVAVLQERVVVSPEGIGVQYPRWVPTVWRSGWQLAWHEVADFQCRTTGQGGLVYYLVTPQRDRAYLLPMRVAGFNRLTQLITQYRGLNTQDIRPLAQPWMYGLLFLFTLVLWGIELGTFLFAWPALNA